MGAPRVTPQEIIQMHRLYKKYGTFAAVSRETGRCAETVARYIRMRGVSMNIRLIVEQALANE